MEFVILSVDAAENFLLNFKMPVQTFEIETIPHNGLNQFAWEKNIKTFHANQYSVAAL